MKNIFQTILIFLFALLSACNSSIDIDKNGNPKVLKIGMSTPSTSGEDASMVFRNMEPLRLYLEKKLDVPVQFIAVSGYAPIVEALKAKKIHVATMAPYPYLIARKTANVKALFTTGNAQGLQVPYKSCLIFNKSLGIKNIDSLKANVHKLTIAFGDPSSTSGHVIPIIYLRENGIDPEKDFKKTVFAPDQLSAVLSVSSGKLDVACVMPQLLNSIYMMNKNISMNNFDIIEISKPIPQSPHCIRKDINPQFAEKVMNAYLELRQTDSAAFYCVLNMYKKYIVFNPDSFRYIAADEKWYDQYEIMIKDIKGLSIE